MLFITHDFGVVAEIADRVVVMEKGLVVEQGAAEQILRRPEHPYTKMAFERVQLVLNSKRGFANGQCLTSFHRATHDPEA